MKSGATIGYQIIKILSLIGSIIALFFIWMSFNEYWKVSVNGYTGGYPFGSVNETPWYYKNSSLYSYYNLFCGFLFLIGLVFTTLGFMKRKIIFSVAGTTIIILLIIINQISAGFQS